MESGQSVRVEGELHIDLWSGGRLIQSLGSVSGEMRGLAAALRAPQVAPSLGDVLRGESWGRLFLELTGRCNERCLHCYASSSPDVSDSLDWGEIESVLLEARDLGFSRLQLTGGDPLISPHLPRSVEMASRLRFEQVEVYTNGLAFRQELAELFKTHAVSMAFSLYSHDPVVHDRVTKTTGSHLRTTASIRLALESGLSVRVAGIQGCDVEQDASRLRDFLLELGVSAECISGDRQRPVGRGTWSDSSFQGSTAHAADEVGRQHGKLSVSYTGDVVPCIFNRNTVLGNIRKSALSDILNRPLAAHVAQTSKPDLLRVIEEPLACTDCRERRELLQSVRW